MVALAPTGVREIVERVCARQDVLDACANRDLGAVIRVFGAHGLTQGQLAGLTGISQGRLSEYKNHKRTPTASTTFELFAGGLGMPPAARQALGLTAAPPVSAIHGAAELPGAASHSDTGLTYPDEPTTAAENVAWLWRSDLGDALARAELEPGAWPGASLRWLVDPGRRPDSGPTARVRIGMTDVDRFRTTVGLFAQLDDRFGGGHARQSLVQYLSADADRLLHGRYTETVGRVLFSATAEATLLAAWMTYDSAPDSALAQRYFIQSLALAQAGDDRLLGASILDAMSHQANYTGHYGEAADLARAAMVGTRGFATATLSAHFHAMEARALARLGDTRACDLALSAAVSEFERRKPESDPEWIGYFDDAELSAELAHCLRDLGRPADAVEYASRSLAAAGDTALVRSDFFVSMVLADSHIAGGNLDKACEVAMSALDGGEMIRSARCVGYVREFGQRLSGTGDRRTIAAFDEQAANSRLWRIAARPERLKSQ